MNLNNVMLTGWIGNVDRVEFASGKIKQRLSIAYHNSYKGKDGNWVNETLWFTVVYWNGKELSKGAKVLVEGALDLNQYTTKEGVERSEVVVLAFRVQVISASADKEKESEAE